MENGSPPLVTIYLKRIMHGQEQCQPSTGANERAHPVSVVIVTTQLTH
jgi:hypothetical protein